MTDAARIAVVQILVWGLAATLVHAAITASCRNLGWSRLDMPFLFGTMFTGDRRSAQVLGFVLFMIGGWFLAFLYFLVFALIGRAGVDLGLVLGLVHAALLLTVLLPLMPAFHPRMASTYAGPDSMRLLEPPGFLALNYGWKTPVVAIAAQAAYGAVLGAGIG